MYGELKTLMRTSQTVLTPDKIFSGVKKSENALMPLIRLRVYRESVCVKAYIEEIANERVKSTEVEKNSEKHGGIQNEIKSNN